MQTPFALRILWVVALAASALSCDDAEKCKHDAGTLGGDRSPSTSERDADLPDRSRAEPDDEGLDQEDPDASMTEGSDAASDSAPPILHLHPGIPRPPTVDPSQLRPPRR